MNARNDASQIPKYALFCARAVSDLLSQEKVTYEEAAARCGKFPTADTIRKWITAGTIPRRDNLEAFARAFGVEVSLFYRVIGSSPLATHEELAAAWKFEVEGKFLAAANAYDSASGEGYSDDLKRAVVRRANVNRRLADQIRRLHAPTLSQTEIPVYESVIELQKWKPNGFVKKVVAHETGRLHHTAIILFLLGSRAAYYRRAPWQKPSNVADFFGGHSVKGERPIDTALREAKEELHIYAGRDRIDWDFQFEDVGQIEFNLDGSIAEDGRINREVSTVFVGRLPEQPYLQFAVYDENYLGSEVGAIPEQHLFFEELPKLAERCSEDPNEFADGARRVLLRYLECHSFSKRLNRLVESNI